MQGVRALGDLPVLTDSHEKPETLMNFVAAQKDKLKSICNKEKNELFSRSEDNMCKYDPFGSLNLCVNSDRMIIVLFLYITVSRMPALEPTSTRYLLNKCKRKYVNSLVTNISTVMHVNFNSQI